MTKLLWAALIVGIFVVLGCSAPGGSNNAAFQEIRVIEADIDAGVVELDSSASFTADDINSDAATIDIVDSEVQAGEYDAGAVLYIEDPDAEGGAVIKKVTSVTSTADGVSVSTEPATIPEAFDSLHIHVRTQLGGDDNYEVRTADSVRFLGVSPSQSVARDVQLIGNDNYSIPGGSPFFGFKMEDYVIWNDPDNTITLDGVFYVSLVGDYTLDFEEYYDEEKLLPKLNTLDLMTFELTGSQFLKLEKSLDLSLLDINDERFPVGTLYFPIGGGVGIDVELYVGFDANASVKLYAGFEESTSLTAGLTYDGENWNHYYSDDAHFELTPISFSGSAAFEPFIGVGVGASLFGVGVGMDAQVFSLVTANCGTGLSIDDFDSPFLDNLYFDGTLDASVGVRMTAGTDYGWLSHFGVDDVEFTLIDESTPILHLPVNDTPDTMPIVFGSLRSGDDGDIYRASMDGTTIQQLTMNDSWDWHPSWSPDGTEIVFCSDRSGSAEIYLMNSDGSGVRLLDTQGGGDHPMFSPDGQTIVFESDRYGDNDIFTMDIDSGAVVRLTSNPWSEERASFSEDGSKIVYTGMISGGEIFMMDANGGNQEQLTDDDIHYWGPDMSPDGSKIVFTGYVWNNFAKTEQDDIFILDLITDEITALTTNKYYDQHPAFSSDGTKIIYTSQIGGFANEDYAICMMNADGSGKEIGSDDGYWDFYVEWMH